ncbi:MAG: hypothetical protein HDR06_07020 [Lachnospiraceae bacterium]|nr:hypothetical protein [Lachnospiraceae bacterium]
MSKDYLSTFEYKQFKYNREDNLLQELLKNAKEGNGMPVHHGGKVGKAAKTLASNASSKGAKSNAGKTLAVHKATKH